MRCAVLFKMYFKVLYNPPSESIDSILLGCQVMENRIYFHMFRSTQARAILQTMIGRLYECMVCTAQQMLLIRTGST